MATYEQIAEYVYRKYGHRIGSNAIAAAKEQMGMDVPRAHNRIDPTRRVTQAPPHIIDAIIEAIEFFEHNQGDSY